MGQNSLRVLLVEDNPGDCFLVKDSLKESRVHHAPTLKDAFSSLDREEFDIILLDLNLPDSSSLSTVKKTAERIKKTSPMIVMTGLNDEDVGLQAIQLGADDYLVKGHFDRMTLMRSIRYSLERNRLKRELWELSIFDELTGLYNRRGFKNLLVQKRKEAERAKQSIILFLVDLNKMKSINDQFGHVAGDLALTDAAHVLKATFRDSDIICRWGGDEFVVLAVDAEPGNVSVIKKRLEANLAEHNARSKRVFNLSLSIGEIITSYDTQHSLEELVEEADKTMYKHKKGC